MIGWGSIFPQKSMQSNKIFLWRLSKTNCCTDLWFTNNGSFLPHHGWSQDILPRQTYKWVSYEMSHETNHMYFSCLIPVRIEFCVSTCCCNDCFNKILFDVVFSFLIIDPMDFAILGMINVKKLHGKLITMYLWSHQIQDALGHNAYSYMAYSLFLWYRKAFSIMGVHVASDVFEGTVAHAVTVNINL